MLQLLCAVAVVWAGSRPADIPNPRASNSWISDVAGVISAEEEARINQRLDALHRDLDVEVAVVTVGDVQGTPKEFATELFNRWGLGDAQTNNGLLVLLVVERGRLEMETGYAMEGVLPDGWLGVMQTRDMIPEARRGNYGASLEKGLASVDARVREGGAPPSIARGPSGKRSSDSWIGDLVLKIVVIIVMVLVGRLIFVVYRWWRDRTCPLCKQTMELLDEVEEDAHLSEEQQAEETVRSVNWLVYVCTPCEFVCVVPRPALFSSWSKCPGCDNRTSAKDATTLEFATTHSGGLVRVHQTCMHCSYENTYLRSTPRLSSSSGGGSGWGSGWGSGGGSFGGGSSGGGGAGSSW